jgi:hypothetical protein
MHIRRPIVVFVTSLTLVGGGALTACASPSGARSGTPADTATDTSATNPSGASQDNLPDNSDPDQGNPEDQNDDNQDPD